MDHLIRQFPGWEISDAATILAWMATETTELRSVRKNANELMKLLGTEVANGLAVALSNAGLPLVVGSLAQPTGIDFGDVETQRMLDILGQNPAFAPHVVALKALGQDTRTRWARSYPDLPLPTVEQVTAAIVLAKTNDAKSLVREWRNSVLLPAVDTAINEGKTIIQIKEVIAAL